MSIKCRTCAATIFNPTAKNLFDEDDDEILQNIEILIGIRLKEDPNMPKHICTCCHLDLYHSIAFRERCLRAENFLHREREQQKVKQQDTVNTRVIESNLIERIIKTEAQSEIAKTETKEHVIEKSIAKNLSQHSTQRRSPRKNSKRANTSRQKPIKTGNKKHPIVSSPAKASPVSKADSDPKVSEQFSTSPRSTADYCEDRSSSFEELSNMSTGDGTSSFPGTEIEKRLPSQSQKKISTKKLNNATGKPTEEQLPKQNNEVTKSVSSEKQKSIVKPAANPRKFICDLCGHAAQSTKSLELHILRHKGEKNFECTECGLKHYSKYLLQLHVRVKHQGEMPFVCRHCGQRFYSATERGRHEAVRHVRNFRYECKVCGKKYLTRSCLNKHEFLHTGLRPYRCDLCNVAFPRKPGLRIHCRTKQHQKRESEALNSQINVVNEITIPDGSIVFPGTIIELVDA